MPSGDYTAIGGGALKLKGAKVQKKKKKKGKTDLEKSISAGDGGIVSNGSPPAPDTEGRDDNEKHEGDDAPTVQKTESERRYEEVRRKRLQKMAESSSSRPEMLKTHKERVEELNTYLSKLSEHHDMPKIGPG
ncbi:hypothetical protein QQS21_009066 [Conoideocrella luteorostrata]|uniref:DUF1754-domain-containing protein n=1 Tax=Conoideocrella luteorostrata TaxID=1105319 RepID=A0AAJ0CM16_9HYPO|nr:hypothetical protein QQS21_009066 [Conoideocrella luteorostrata]